MNTNTFVWPQGFTQQVLVSNTECKHNFCLFTRRKVHSAPLFKVCPSLSSINPTRGTMSHRNKLDSLLQSSNWVRSSSQRTSDTECSLQMSFLCVCVCTFFFWVSARVCVSVRDPPSVVWEPVRQAGTWGAWRRRAARMICWWTLLPPNQTERACRGRYTPRVSQPAENNNNTSDNKVMKTSAIDFLALNHSCLAVVCFYYLFQE